ncbi:Dynein light chain LC6, flagellar outer arm [Schistosoma japonicum]|nr:Dynein light chain LC6, flagellar outer arm [Schistosoma japonicum]
MKHYDIVVEANELPTERKTTALTLCIHALDYYQTEKDVAMFMKKNFDKLYGPIWQCIVGHEFGIENSTIKIRPSRAEGQTFTVNLKLLVRNLGHILLINCTLE